MSIRQAIIFDTETTGLVKPLATPIHEQPQIIEFAAIKVDFDSLEELDRINFLVDPGCELPEIITKITGITNQQLEDEEAMPFADSFDELAEFFLGVHTLVAHNLTFDTSLLRFELQRIGCEFKFPWPPKQICTVEASFELHNRRMKLCQLHEEATGAPHKEAHRAMADVEGLLTCVKYLREKELI